MYCSDCIISNPPTILPGRKYALRRNDFAAVLGHFVNNGVAVFAAWWLGPEWLAEGMNPSEGSLGLTEAITSALGAVAIIGSVWWLKEKTKRPEVLAQ